MSIVPKLVADQSSSAVQTTQTQTTSSKIKSDGRITASPPKSKPSKHQETHIYKLFKDMNTDPQSLHTSLIRMYANHLTDSKTGLFLIHYLQKAAGYEGKTAQDFNRPISCLEPMHLQKKSYHRDYDRTNSLLNSIGTSLVSLVNANETELKKMITDREILLVQGPSFKATLEAYADIVDIDSVESFDTLVEQLLKNTQQNPTCKEEFVFAYIDKMVKSSLPFPERVKKVKEINQSLIDRLEARLAKPDVSKEQASLVRARLGIVSHQEIKGATILVIPLYIAEEGKPNLQMIASNFRNPFIKQRIAWGGQTPTMIQGRELLHKIKGEELFASKTKKKSITFQNYKNMQSFFTDPSVSDYKNLGVGFRTADKSNPSTIALLSSANSRMLECLSPKLEKAMHDKDHGKLIQGSLNRIAYLMEQGVAEQDNHAKYCLSHELISEELMLLLNILEPYQEGDFEKIFLKNREQGLDKLYTSGKRPTLDPAIERAVLPMSSGMACVDGIIRGLRQIKPNLKIACLNDNYFETFANLEKLSGKSIQGDDQKPSFASIDAKNLDRTIKKFKGADLVFFDLHASPSTSATSYDAKDIDKITDALLEGRTAKQPLTIALDITLDKIHSKDLNEFLCKHQDAIKEGKLNIYLYRSGHKFDQLGVDKFNAGYLEVYTLDKKTKDIFTKLEGQLSGLDFQALCHFHENADMEIHQYLKKHYKNTNIAYKELSSLSAAQKSFLQLTPKKDSKSYYVEFTYPQMSSQSATFQCKVMEYATAEAQKLGIALVDRDSFGFNESTMCLIGDKKIRCSFGSHSPEEIKSICGIFLGLESKIQAAMQKVGPPTSNQAEAKFMDQLTATL